MFLHIIILKRKQVNNNARNLRKHRSKIVRVIIFLIA